VAVNVGDRVLLPEFGGAKVRCPTVQFRASDQEGKNDPQK